MKQMKFSTGFLILIAALLLSVPGIAQVKDYQDIKFPKLPDFDIPQPETFTLNNGMTVFLMEDHELPLISVTARIRTGSNYMPGEREGMGDIFGQVQREGGTASMTGDEMDDFLEARAASVETGMSGDMATASMNCLEEDFDEVFEVFIDVLRKPAFSEDKIELAKVQSNTSIARRNDSVGSIVGREFSRLVYGADSPLARLSEYATVAAVTRDDLVAWHSKSFHPNNILLGVSGDFDSTTMKGKIEAALNSWPKGTAFAEPEVAYQKQVKPGVYFIEKEDVTQANIRMGHLGIKRDNPDYYAVVVMNEILGGGFSGRLMQNIRSEKGLAYSVFGRIGASFLRPGLFQAGMGTKSSTMAESVEALKEEIDGMIANPPTDVEMQHAKEGILNSFVFNYTSRAQILGQQMTFAYYGLPTDYLEQYRANIETVKSEQVAAVAKKYLHPDKMALLIVGKSEDFDQPVATLGEVTEIDISITPPPDTRPEIEATAANVEAGAELLERMARKLSNGVEAAVESIQSSQTMVLNMGGQKMSMSQEVAVVLPDKVRQSMKTPMGEMVTVINGGQGVMLQGGTPSPLPPEMAERALKQLGRDLLILSSNVGDPELQAVAGGTDEVDGTACDIVEVTFKGSESRLCINGDGTVLKQSFQGKHPMQGTPGTITLLFSDYVEQAGRMLPRISSMNFEGEEFATVTVESLEINADVDATLFDLPATE